MALFPQKTKTCEVVFIEQNVIVIKGHKYHHNEHELQEIRNDFKEIKKGLKAILNKIEPPIPPELEGKDEGYFSEIKITEGNSIISFIKGKLNIMALSLTDTQQASGVLTFKDKKLAIADVPDGNVTLSVADTNVATATYEDATNTVTVVAGQPGVTALTIKATNKAGADIPFDDIAIEVLGGDAVTGGVAFTDPIEQP